jgi:hypothetical protein
MPNKSPSAQSARPSLKAIKAETDHLLNAACLFFKLHTRDEPIDNKLDLRGDLLLESEKVEALAVALTTISVGYRGGEPLSKDEVAGCATVGDVAAAVHRRAKGSAPGARVTQKTPKPTRTAGKRKK